MAKRRLRDSQDGVAGAAVYLAQLGFIARPLELTAEVESHREGLVVPGRDDHAAEIVKAETAAGRAKELETRATKLAASVAAAEEQLKSLTADAGKVDGDLADRHGDRDPSQPCPSAPDRCARPAALVSWFRTAGPRPSRPRWRLRASVSAAKERPPLQGHCRSFGLGCVNLGLSVEVTFKGGSSHTPAQSEAPMPSR
jgi:hypothetical protein